MKRHKRSQRSELYVTLLDCLKKEALSISDLSRLTDINWETTKRTLERLEKLGIVGEKEEKNRRVFFVKDTRILEEEPDTLLGIPLKKNQREATKELFKKIKDTWYKNTDRPLNRTFLQKIAVKVTKEENIENIPFGWYLFGMMSMLQCDPSEEIVVATNHLGNRYDDKIKNIVIKYQRFRNTDELMRTQYIEEGNDLYLSKLDLNQYLLKPIMEQEIPTIKRKILNIAFNFKKTEDNNEIIELTNIFVSIVGQLLNKLTVGELEDVRSNILESFKALWECIATYNLYNSLLEKGFYEKGVLHRYYTLKIDSLLEVCETYLSYLNDLLPKEKPIEDNLSKFKGSQA